MRCLIYIIKKSKISFWLVFTNYVSRRVCIFTTFSVRCAIFVSHHYQWRHKTITCCSHAFLPKIIVHFFPFFAEFDYKLLKIPKSKWWTINPPLISISQTQKLQNNSNRKARKMGLKGVQKTQSVKDNNTLTYTSHRLRLCVVTVKPKKSKSQHAYFRIFLKFFNFL